jgi:hypothetical protein
LSFYAFLAPLLYYVTAGFVLVLFCSAIATLIWTLMKLRLLLIRCLGGAPAESASSGPAKAAIERKRSHARLVPEADAP